MDYLILIPTYNEISNIRKIYSKIRKHNSSIHILFIDDSSPDGTALEVESIAKEDKGVYILQREKKQGIAKAYIDGFKWGMGKGYKYFIEMDCDGSHDPQYLAMILEALKTNDVVVCSRYIEEGGIEKWVFFRKMISYLGSFYSALILGLPIKDLTGGFNAWRREVVEKIDMDKVISKNFTFQIEMKYLAFINKFKITEVPYTYHKRKEGISKMSPRIIIEGLLKVPMIRAMYRR